MSAQVLGDVQLITKKELEAALEAVIIPEADIDAKIETVKTAVEAEIQTAKEAVESEVTLVDSKLTQEIQRATAKEAELDDKITDEATIRENTDDALRSRIEREEGVRQAADEQLAHTITVEASERQAADEQLQANIDTLAEKIDPSVSQLTQLITDEQTARVEACAELETKINQNATDVANEIITRENADTALDTKIEALKETSNDSFEDTIFVARLDNLPLAQMTVENKDKTIAVGDIIGSVSSKYLPKIPVTFSFVTEATGAGEDKYAYVSCRLDAAGNVVVINKTLLSDSYEGNVNSATVFYITKE